MTLVDKELRVVQTCLWGFLPGKTPVGCGSLVGSEAVYNYLMQADPISTPLIRHILSRRFGHENISVTILSSADSRRAVTSCQLMVKECTQSYTG